MAVIDRRKKIARRASTRHRTRIDVVWESPGTKLAARIGDISVSGCFLLSGGEVDDGQIVKIHFPLNNGKKALFWGKVVNNVYDVGFGVQFVGLTDFQTARLDNFIHALEVSG